MSRIAEILLRVRDSLSDQDATRWSNDRLLRLIDEAQKDLAQKARLLRTKTEISILTNINVYSLPSDALFISRVVDADGERIPVKSHDQMDDIDSLWETRTGEGIEYIIFDELDPGCFKIYPIPESSDASESFTITDYGLTTEVTDDVMSSDYGVVVDVSVDALTSKSFSSIYGIMTSMAAVDTEILVYYCKKPANIDQIDIGTSVLEIHPIYDKAIKHYVIGMAWRDDQDTQNRQLGNDELGLHKSELSTAKKNSSSNHTRSNKRTPSYRTGFENGG